MWTRVQTIVLLGVLVLSCFGSAVRLVVEPCDDVRRDIDIESRREAIDLATIILPLSMATADFASACSLAQTNDGLLVMAGIRRLGDLAPSNAVPFLSNMFYSIAYERHCVTPLKLEVLRALGKSTEGKDVVLSIVGSYWAKGPATTPSHLDTEFVHIIGMGASVLCRWASDPDVAAFAEMACRSTRMEGLGPAGSYLHRLRLQKRFPPSDTNTVSLVRQLFSYIRGLGSSVSDASERLGAAMILLSLPTNAISLYEAELMESNKAINATIAGKWASCKTDDDHKSMAKSKEMRDLQIADGEYSAPRCGIGWWFERYEWQRKRAGGQVKDPTEVILVTGCFPEIECVGLYSNSWGVFSEQTFYREDIPYFNTEEEQAALILSNEINAVQAYGVKR